MQFAPLSAVKHLVKPGQPLPFNVRDADGTLLLARGRMVDSPEQLVELFTRGALVDIAELKPADDDISTARRDELPAIWSRCLTQVAQTLAQAGESDFASALDAASAPVQSLIARDPDLAIFQVLRRGHNSDFDYGAQRALRTAITCALVAQRLGWDAAQTERAFKVGLTMNISMLELQGQLARQTTPPTQQQLTALQSHPMRSLRLLQQAGVNDADWLHGVLRHHEKEDGSGYPSGCTDIGDLASLARRADEYTAKLSWRASRESLAADQAGREMFMREPGNAMTAALVKEFGLYPPGCYVRLSSGELAIVVERGQTITTPVVACLTNERGMPLPKPMRMRTTDRAHQVAGVVGERSVNVRVPLDRLMAAVVG
jgi:HD-GYP domain-containing protein (c-di-GMP phosphodiesterase class II)